MSLASVYINRAEQRAFERKSLLLAFIRKVHSKMFGESSTFNDNNLLFRCHTRI